MQGITRHFVFGDSYSANSYPTIGFERISDGPTWAELASEAMGLVTTGRYTYYGTWSTIGPVSGYYTPGTIVTGSNAKSYIALKLTTVDPVTDDGTNWALYQNGTLTGWSFSLAWDNYAASGADMAADPQCLQFQINQFLSDCSSAVPSGSFVDFAYTGVNDLDGIYVFVGSPNGTTDPLCTLATGFIMPAVGSTVGSIGFSSITNLVANQFIWIAGAGLMQLVGSPVPGNSNTLQNVGSYFSTTNVNAGASVPSGGNVRSAGYQMIDDLLSTYHTLVESVISAGASQILMTTCPLLGVAPAIAEYGNTTAFNQYASYWNTAILAKFASITTIYWFRLDTAFANLWANPLAYGFTIPDNYDNASAELDTHIWFDSPGLHPSGKLHRYYFSQWTQAALGIPVLTQAGAQRITLLERSNLFLPTGVPSFGGSTWVTSNGENPTGIQSQPPLIGADDLRLIMAQSITEQRLIYGFSEDFDKTVFPNAPEPDGSWTVVDGGVTKSGITAVAGTVWGFHGQGGAQFTVGNVGDYYGHYKSTFIFWAASGWPTYMGPFFISWRICHILNPGDTIVMRGGLIDAMSTTRPANGMFFEVQDADGSITANFVLASGGTDYTLNFPLSWPSNTPLVDLHAFSDSLGRRWHIMQGNTYQGMVEFPSTALPSATLYGSQQAVKTAGNPGPSYCLVDFFGVKSMTQGRMT